MLTDGFQTPAKLPPQLLSRIIHTSEILLQMLELEGGHSITPQQRTQVHRLLVPLVRLIQDQRLLRQQPQ
jgi:hypothetical protein